ncbi:MAG TPA: carbohydrate ABC transporter permease [bacterium]|nr:carbohydrate ABC transporter permease [bacterium]
MLVLCAVALLPIYFMVISAFKTDVGYAQSPLGLPHPITLENFLRVFRQSSILRGGANSVVLTISSVGIALLVSTPAAYAFARMPFPGADLLFRLIAALMAVPVISVLIPLFVFMVNVHLINTYPAAILVYVGFLIPYKIFFLTAFFRQLPSPIIEAAILDGCNTPTLLRRVVVPLAKPALIAMAVISIIWVWNELLIALVFLQTDASRTLMVGLTVFQDEFRIDVPVTMAGLVLAVVPIVLVYMAGIRYFVSGFLGGAVHGE